MRSATSVANSRVPMEARHQGVTVNITATAWHPERDLTVEDWISQGRRLAFVGKGVAWWIGDWLRYGNLRWGDRYAKAARVIGYDAQTLMNMVYVAAAYAPEDRRPGLSWSHHAELAGLDPAERRRWMDLAEDQRMSVRCLRQELRLARRRREQDQAGEPLPLPATPAAGHSPSRCPQCGFEIASSEARDADSPASHPQAAAHGTSHPQAAARGGLSAVPRPAHPANRFLLRTG